MFKKGKTIAKKRCRTGVACGSSCIAKGDVCRLKVGQIASHSEINNLKQSIVKFKLEQNTGSIVPTTQPPTQPALEKEDIPVKSKYVVNPETGTPYTIRELRKQASEKKIYGYGSMTIKELQGTLQLYDQKPESRKRITQGIAKRTGLTNRAIKVAGLSGRGTPLERTTKRNLKNTADTWRKLETLAKFAGSSTTAWTAAAVGAFLLGQSIKNYERIKQTYREGFEESARFAEERASKLNIQHPVEKDGEPVLLKNGKPRMSSHIPQDNITFVVGSGKGYGAQEMKALLQKSKDPADPKEYWFTHSNYVIPHDLKEFGTPRPPGGGNPPVASVVVNGIGGIVQNLTRKRNQDAVDLAAQIYAHAIAVSPKDGRTLVNRNKKINIVAHCTGGSVTKEALEILSRMQVKGSPSGKKVLERVNSVYLGTPHLGITENVSRRQRTIVSPRDPISTLPVFGDGARQQWISSVKGGNASDYLNDDRVRDAIRESFGYYQGSPEEIRRRNAKRGDSLRLHFDRHCAPNTKECGKICIPKSRTCHKNGALGQPGSPGSTFIKSGVAAGAIVSGTGGAVLISGAFLGIAANVPLLKASELSIFNQKHLNELQPDGKPKQGASGATRFVKDAEGNRFVFKEILNPTKLLESSAEATTSDMAAKSGIKLNKVSLIPANLSSPIKLGIAGASLHSIAPGKTLTDEVKDNPDSPFSGINIKQVSGFKEEMISSISKHPDLPKLAAFDTFVGNWDRKSDNLFYDKKTDSFTGIDNGLSFTRNLPSRTLRNLKNVDFDKLPHAEKKALDSYNETLKQLRQEHNYTDVQSRFASYVVQEKGEWNVIRRYVVIKNIEKNYRDTNKLIDFLDTKLKTPKKDSAYDTEKTMIRMDIASKCHAGSVPCGNICLPPGKKCRLSLPKPKPNGIREKAKAAVSERLAAMKPDGRKIRASLGRGSIGENIGGLGQDLERAYLRTSRLSQQAKNRKNKNYIPPTKSAQVKERLIHELKLGGVLLGQGTISKKIKEADKKLIDFSDQIDEHHQKISHEIEGIKNKASKSGIDLSSFAGKHHQKASQAIADLNDKLSKLVNKK